MKKLLVAACFVLVPQLVFAQKGKADKAQQEGMAKMQELMEGMANAKTRSVYKFPMSMTMRVTGYNNGTKKGATDIKYHINPAEETFAFAGEENKGGGKEMMVVYDARNNTMVMLDENKNSYMAMNVNAFMGAEVQANKGKGSADIKCSKTGRSKVIQGYPADEYVCVDKDRGNRSEVFVTNKIPVNIAKSAKGSPMAAYFSGLEDMQGMMEGKFYKKDKLEATIEVVQVNQKSNHSVTLGNYQKMNMFGGR